MDTHDRKAIEDLFAKLDGVERQAGPRDAEAESFIADRVSRQPGAPYYMAQTIVMQEMALERAQQELDELRQAQAAPQQSGGLLGRLFGGGQPAARAPAMSRGAAAAGASGAWSGSAGAQAAQPGYAPQGRGGGGGFLAGAAQTAMGVAGGVLLGNAIGGLFAGDEPASATAAAEPAADEPQVEEAAYDGGGFEDFGDEI
jgi:hypothetical protein